MLRNILLFFLALGHGLVVQAQQTVADEPEPVVASKEYFVQQQPDEVIVVRIEAAEAVFTSVVSIDDGEELSRSGLPEARMMPIFQYVPEPPAQRQIDIDVSATQVTNRTEFQLLTTRLNIRDERSAKLATAYRLLAAGLEVVPDANIPAWTVKIQTLMRGGQTFEELGMRELGLWSSVYGAHLILHRLRDPQTARDWADEILAVPRVERYEEIEFAARKLRSNAMAAGAQADPSSPSNAGNPGSDSAGSDNMNSDNLNSPLQTALAQTAASARALGYRYEEASALQAAGVDLKRHGQVQAALERLEQALSIAEEIEAGDLATAIREHVVELHGAAGNTEASGAVLQDIESHLLESGESEELARNLLQQGLLYIDRHSYAQAIEVLSRADGLEQSSLTRLRSQLALGRALSEAGRTAEALTQLHAAVIHPGSGSYREPSSVLPLFAALGDLAAIHRERGDYQDMGAVRTAQRGHAGNHEERAQWAYEHARDALKQYGPAAGITRERFEAGWRLRTQGNESSWTELARLRLCALPGKAGEAGTPCTASATEAAFQSIRAAGTPRQTAEAALAYSRLFTVRGETTRALEIADSQIETLLESGTAELGAWYWRSRASLFENYLELALQSERGDDAASSLLALARARALERAAGAATPAPDMAAMRAFLGKLPADSAVLSFHLGASDATAWLATANDIQRIALPGPDRIKTLCADIRAASTSQAWAAFDLLAADLGDLLLAPVAKRLPPSVFLVSQGVLAGIPVDALVVGDEPLAARHSVAHLDVFPPVREGVKRLGLPLPEKVFLAGDPRDWSGDFAMRLDASAEIESLTARFVGPGLDTVRGVALLADEFTDGRYGDADLVHLSIPGVIELSAPRESSLRLSEPARGEGRQELSAHTLSDLPTQAALVFFSGTAFTGTGAALESRLGVVSAVLDAGAAAAIATLWPVADESRSRIVSGFYDHLFADGNAATALARAKRESMASGHSPDWASFQLFLN